MAAEQHKHPATAPPCPERGRFLGAVDTDADALRNAVAAAVSERRPAGGQGQGRHGSTADRGARPPVLFPTPIPTAPISTAPFPTVLIDPLAAVEPICLPAPVVEAVGPTPWGERIAEITPGPELAALVAGLDPAGTATQDMVEMVAAADRLMAWVHFQRARWARELADRPEMHPWETTGVRPQEGCVAADELAMRLGTSRRQTTTMVVEGDAFATTLYETGQALCTGAISPAKATVLARRLTEVSPLVAQEVEDLVLPTAPTRTVSQLARDVERALVQVDADGAADRHARARAGRRVCHPRLLPDGMAGMWCVLPAGDAMRIDGVLETTARALRAAGDGRNLDQARADTLRDLVLGMPSSEPEQSDRAEAEEGAAAAVPTPSTGWEPEHGTGSSQGHGSGGGRGRGSGGSRGRGAGSGRGTGCGRPHGTAAIQVTVPLSTLVGVDEHPATLHGYGPIGAEQARQIAHRAGSVWRRIVTDPLTGAVLDVGRTRYTPPAPLAAHVRARDQRCAAPGCDVSAGRADLDHTIEYHGTPNGPPAPPGTTAADNLGPLCRHHHQLKTDRGFVLRQPEPGTFDWTTPAGHRYRTRPGADTGYLHLGRDGRSWPRPLTAGEAEHGSPGGDESDGASSVQGPAGTTETDPSAGSEHPDPRAGPEHPGQGAGTDDAHRSVGMPTERAPARHRPACDSHVDDEPPF